jgi:c-di-GMP-binding flagellar brake protein YcgR
MGLNDQLRTGKVPAEGVGARPDRRRSSRVGVPGCEVYYTTPLLPLLMRAPKGEKCLLVNIGGGGLQFVSENYLESGKKLSLLAIVPAFLGYLTFRARVIWSRKIQDKKLYQVGVEFLKMDRETQTKLNSLRRDVSLRSNTRKSRPAAAQA